MILLPLIVSLLVIIGCHLIFLYLVRPVLISRLQFRLFELRDDMRLRALKKELGPNAEGYSILERRLNNAVTAVFNLDVAEVLSVPYNRTIALEIANESAIISENPQLKEIYEKSIQCLVGAIILNSPIMFVVIPTIAFVAIHVRKVAGLWESIRYRTWEASSSSPCHA